MDCQPLDSQELGIFYLKEALNSGKIYGQKLYLSGIFFVFIIRNSIGWGGCFFP